MRIRSVHTVPVWNDGGRPHVAALDEIRPDLEDKVIGWANLAVIDLGRDFREAPRTFILVYTKPSNHGLAE